MESGQGSDLPYPLSYFFYRMLVLFSEVASAGEKLRDSRNLGMLQREIAPWINAFYTMGMAGIDGVRALLTESLPERMDVFFRMVDKLESIKALRRDAWVNGKVEQVAPAPFSCYTGCGCAQADR